MDKLGIVGRGAWARNITNTLDAIGGVRWITNPKPSDPLDAVIIANKSCDHVRAAVPFLQTGCPCFIEKPAATSLADIVRLGTVARMADTCLFVGHLHLFNPACQVFLDHVSEIGELFRIEGVFANNKPRDDVSVIWDWLPHPLSIAPQIFGSRSRAASARALDHPERPFTVEAQVWFGDQTFDMRASWQAPKPETRITATGEQGQLIFDDRADQKVILLQKGKAVHPPYPATPPLHAELQAFLDTLRGISPNPSPLAKALPVIQALDAIERSCLQHGETVQITR